jgi:hypothetical protein
MKLMNDWLDLPSLFPHVTLITGYTPLKMVFTTSFPIWRLLIEAGLFLDEADRTRKEPVRGLAFALV